MKTRSCIQTEWARADARSLGGEGAPRGSAQRLRLLLLLVCLFALPALFPARASADSLSLPTGRTISDGYYAIYANSNTSYAVGAIGDERGGNVQLMYFLDNDDYQVWRFSYLGDGLYCVENCATHLYLNVSDWGRGTDVVQYRGTRPADNEKWYVVSADGAFYLVPYCQRTRALDISDGIIAANTNIQIWDQNRSYAQRFFLWQITGKAGNLLPLSTGATISEGIYQILPKENQNYAVAATGDNTGESMTLRPYSASSDYQSWSFQYLGNGLYSIANVGSGQFLDVANWGLDRDVVQYRDGGAALNELWYVVNENGDYYLVPYCQPSQALDVASGNYRTGTNVQIWDQTRGGPQKFSLVKTGATLRLPTGPTKNDGYYAIQSTTSVDLALGTIGGWDGVNMGTYYDNPYQIWRIMYLDSGLYCIENCGSKLYLSVSDDGELYQSRYQRPADNQKWYIVYSDSNVYLVPYSQRDKALEFSGASEVYVSYQKMDSSQKVRLVQKSGKDGSRLTLPTDSTIPDGDYAIRPAGESCYAVSANFQSDDEIMLREYDSAAPLRTWTFTHVGNGLYTIENRASKKFLDVAAFGLGNYVVQYRDGGPALNQLWYVIRYNSRWYLVPYCQPSTALDVIDANNLSAGSDVLIAQQHLGASQQFCITEVTETTDIRQTTVGSLDTLVLTGTDDVTLVEGVDYLVDETSTNPDGTLTVTVIGIGAFTGSMEVVIPGSSRSMNVQFNSNGGTEPSPDSKTVYYGQRYGALPATARTGYSFDGWWTDPTGGTRITEDTLVTVSEPDPNMLMIELLYAHWTPNAYTLTFDGNGGGTPSQLSKTIYYEQAYGPLATMPPWTGHSFGGWWTAPSGGRRVTADTVLTALENRTVYAHWTTNRYTVSFDDNGAPGSNPTAMAVTYGQDYGALPTMSWTGHVFDGWWTALSGGELITAETPVRITADQTLYAHWTANRYTVYFDGNGGPDPVPDEKIVTYYEPYGELPEAQRDGFRQNGWWDSAYNGTEIKSTTYVLTARNHTLFAHWIENTYTVSYDANGGAGAPEPQTKRGGSPLTLSEQIPTRKGFRFIGWREGETIYAPGARFVKNEDTVLRAVWEPVPDLVLPSSLTRIEAEAFAGGAFSCVAVPDTVTQIGAGAFADCDELACAVFCGDRITIADGAFPNGIVFRCRAGSDAHTYALTHDITAELID